MEKRIKNLSARLLAIVLFANMGCGQNDSKTKSSEGNTTNTADTGPHHAIQWQKLFGGTGDETAFSIQQTTDSGYIVAGFSYSPDDKADSTNGYWILKFNVSGAIQWQRSLGGTRYSNKEFPSVRQTKDNGYIFAGYADPQDKVPGKNHGGNDYRIVKLNSKGAIQWQNLLGGSLEDMATSVYETNDGGCIVAGFSFSTDGDIKGHSSSLVTGYDPNTFEAISVNSSDYWIVKLSSTGKTQWQKTMGGHNNEFARSICQTTDGGYIVAGSLYNLKKNTIAEKIDKVSLTLDDRKFEYARRHLVDGGYRLSQSYNTYDSTMINSHGKSDYWIIKLNSSGEIMWQKAFGGSEEDEAYAVQQTKDGGYIVAGYSYSTDGDVTGIHEYIAIADKANYWVVKMDSTGNKQWQRSLGGAYDDKAYSVQQCKEGGYVVAGYSNSQDGNVSANGWIVKLNDSGAIEWQNSLGGSEWDEVHCIQQTIDKGYIIIGSSSSNDGEFKTNNGKFDYWIVKLE